MKKIIALFFVYTSILPFCFTAFPAEKLKGSGILTTDIDRYQKKRVRFGNKMVTRFSAIDSLIFPKVKVLGDKSKAIKFQIPPGTVSFMIALENKKTNRIYYVTSLKGPQGQLMQLGGAKTNRVFSIYDLVKKSPPHVGPAVSNLLVPNSSRLKENPLTPGEYEFTATPDKRSSTPSPPWLRATILIKRALIPQKGLSKVVGFLKVNFILPKMIFVNGQCYPTKLVIKELDLPGEFKKANEKMMANQINMNWKLTFIDVPCKGNVNEYWEEFSTLQEKIYFKNLQGSFGSEINVFLAMHDAPSRRDIHGKWLTQGLASSIAGPSYMGLKRNGIWVDINPIHVEQDYMAIGVPMPTGDVIRHEIGHYLGLFHRWEKIPVEGVDTIDNIMGYGPRGTEGLRMWNKVEKIRKDGFPPFVKEQERIMFGHPAVTLYYLQ